MPAKFNAKNFSYTKPDDEPAFLRRLRGQVSGTDRNHMQQRPVGTAKKARLAFDDDEGPTIAYEREGGGNVGREEWEALTKSKLAETEAKLGVDADGVVGGGEDEGQGRAVGKGEGAGGSTSRHDRVQELNSNLDLNLKKRKKVGRVVGGDPDGDGGGDDAGLEEGGAATGASGRVDATTATATARREAVGVKEAVAESTSTSTTTSTTKPAVKDSRLKHKKNKKVKLSFDDA